MKADIEPPLRFAVGYAQNAMGYLNRIEHGDDIEKAIKHFNKAVAAIQRYATVNEIELKESMPT